MRLLLIYSLAAIAAFTSACFGDDDAGAYDADGGPTTDADVPDPPQERRAEVAGTADPFLDGSEDFTSLCANDIDDDLDGLADCLDPGCLSAPECCASTLNSGIDGDFSLCGEELGACGWTAWFGQNDGDAVRIEDDVVVLAGNGIGEVGFVSQPLLGLTGEPTLTFVASLNPETCGDESCRQVVGVAMTHQDEAAAGAGVLPTVGIVLDGEIGAIRLYVAGRIEATIEPPSAAMLREPHHYGFQLHNDGTTSFWVLLDTVGYRNDDIPLGVPTYDSLSPNGIDSRALRVTAFGRVTGDRAARIDGIHLDRSICDVPSAFSRARQTPVLSPPTPLPMVADPAVFDDGEILRIVFEADNRLMSATSDDGGEHWAAPTPLEMRSSSTDYGLVARREPAVIRWAAPGEPERWHLWFVGEAERGRTVPDGVMPTAIIHAISDDGENWVEAEAPEAVVADATLPFLHGVSAPTVAASIEGNGLLMWFVGHHAFDVGRTLLVARSDDGKIWEVDVNPIEFLGDDRDFSYELDGRGDPEVVVRGDAYQMWYVGRSGARASIGLAVSSDGIRWERWGLALEAEMAWEAWSLSGPTVAYFATDEPGIDLCRMWYHGGSPGRERVGLVTRPVPAR